MTAMRSASKQAAGGERGACRIRSGSAWGPYLSERAWGTVREDYSADGDAWENFPHDQARSRAYRWSEDGLGGICDDRQTLCFAFALWNGRDPILKERIFGLTGNEGNHGEDAKEYWWYLDCDADALVMRWRYAYPQAAFPYDELIAENRAATARLPSSSCSTRASSTGPATGTWTVDYAKAAPDDICMRVHVRNAGPDTAPPRRPADAVVSQQLVVGGRRREPSIRDTSARSRREDPALGGSVLAKAAARRRCSARTRPTPSAVGRAWRPPYPKDGIGNHVVRRSGDGQPGARRHQGGAALPPRSRRGRHGREIGLRLGARAPRPNALVVDAIRGRAREADAFYAGLAPRRRPRGRRAAPGARRDAVEQAVLRLRRRALAERRPRPASPAREPRRRNADWRHVYNEDVISMPDKWEYPWYAAWDLAFHCVALAHVDPEFAKQQLRLITREWYMHPNGQLPAYEWNFGDVNPPVHALAALAVFRIDGAQDREWLARVFHKLLLGFTWWVNVKDPEGDHLFGGGFLGMDNIGPFDRSAPLPDGLVLEQADGDRLDGAVLPEHARDRARARGRDRAYEDVAVKFFEHYALIAEAINDRGLWDEADGFYYDQIRRISDGAVYPVRVRSMTGLIPLCAVATGPQALMDRLDEFGRRARDFLRVRPEYAPTVDPAVNPGDVIMLSLVGRDRLPRVLERLADPNEFLSPHGLRSLSAAYRDRPFELWQDGHVVATIDYEPAESTTALFGGNSNWRGPIWFPVNYLVIGALERFASRLGDEVTFEFPHGSGRQLTLTQVSGELRNASSGSSSRTPRGGGRCSGTASIPTRPGTTRCCFTSISMATTDAAWAPLIRPAGPGWWPM